MLKKLFEKLLHRKKYNAPPRGISAKRHKEDVEYAYKVLNIEDFTDDVEKRCYQYFIVLNGIGIARVGKNLSKPHNHRAVVDAIHLLKKDYPDKCIMEYYRHAMLISIKSISATRGLVRVLDMLNYEFYLEDNHLTEYVLDLDGVCEKFDGLEERNDHNYLYNHSYQKQIDLIKQRARMQSAIKADKTENV